MKIKISNCPTCGSDTIRLVTCTLHREFKGEKYTVPDITFYECPACGEHVYDLEAMDKFEAHSPAYRKRRRKRAAS